jgi:hypothetical protein
MKFKETGSVKLHFKAVNFEHATLLCETQVARKHNSLERVTAYAWLHACMHGCCCLRVAGISYTRTAHHKSGSGQSLNMVLQGMMMVLWVLGVLLKKQIRTAAIIQQQLN